MARAIIPGTIDANGTKVKIFVKDTRTRNYILDGISYYYKERTGIKLVPQFYPLFNYTEEDCLDTKRGASAHIFLPEGFKMNPLEFDYTLNIEN